MKLDIQFKELEILVSRMGASPVSWKSDVEVIIIKPDWKITLEEKVIDVDIHDIDITPDGLLNWNGEQILLYIKEVRIFGYYETKLPKFHFYQCRTLDDMKNKGRIERYVVTQRKSGTFLIDTIMNGELSEKIKKKNYLSA
jgi:hypothetical protein